MKLSLALVILSWVLCSFVSAAPPKSPTINEYQALLLRSPFIIKKPEVKVPEVVVTSALALRGVAALDDGWYVVVVDRKNPTSNIILREGQAANNEGLRLISVNQNALDYNKTTVQVMSGGRTQTVAYNPADIKKSLAAAKATVAKSQVKSGSTTRPPLPTTQTTNTTPQPSGSSTRRPRVRRTVTAPTLPKTR